MRPHRQRAKGPPELGSHPERLFFHLQLSGLNLREVEHIVDDGQERLRRCLRHRQVLPLLPVQAGLQHQLDHPHDSIHGRPDFVTHVCQKLALGPAGRSGFFLQRLLRLELLPNEFGLLPHLPSEGRSPAGGSQHQERHQSEHSHRVSPSPPRCRLNHFKVRERPHFQFKRTWRHPFIRLLDLKLIDARQPKSASCLQRRKAVRERARLQVGIKHVIARLHRQHLPPRNADQV